MTVRVETQKGRHPDGDTTYHWFAQTSSALEKLWENKLTHFTINFYL